ncbi:transposase [Novosphingobium sp. TW-4]|uniref:Transposase n=1 Tax=Novosphingobium olei TaxID=2728851 RepID=A0A7Y0BTE8_9SPHN|nr:transposase [Novosphingobium olei]NML96227.1 transposase [Novosphingobium olei]
MGQITVFSGPERRRRWNDDERLQILTEAFPPGACVAEVARRHDVSTAPVYTWRRKLREAHAEPAPDDLAAPGFAAAVIVEDAEAAHLGSRPCSGRSVVTGLRCSGGMVPGCA